MDKNPNQKETWLESIKRNNRTKKKILIQRRMS